MKLILHARTALENIEFIDERDTSRWRMEIWIFACILDYFEGYEKLLCPLYFRIVDNWRTYLSKFDETTGGTVEFMTENGREKGINKNSVFKSPMREICEIRMKTSEITNGQDLPFYVPWKPKLSSIGRAIKVQPSAAGSRKTIIENTFACSMKLFNPY